MSITVNNVIWFEIPIHNVDKALIFYQKVFGWSLKEFSDAPETSR